jgi:hypothetical protein
MADRHNSKHSAEVRAAATAALLAGQSVSQVAKEYSLPKGTVSSWRARAGAGNATQKVDADDIGTLLVTLLRANIRGLISIAGVMNDPKWVREQSAAELGTFLGITHDKVVRMLEAMGNSVPIDGDAEGSP